MLLEETLQELNLSDAAIAEASSQIVRSAQPDDNAMSKVYSALNADLKQAVHSSALTIRHITGEARVLIDPAHRNVIAENHERGLPTRIACRQHAETPISDAYTFFAAQRDRWAAVTWSDLIDIASLCARGSIRISVLDKPADIHYSLFGRDLALIQGQHEHPSERKNIWYVRSPRLVSELADPTNVTFNSSRRISPMSFDAMLQWMYSDGVYELIGTDSPPQEAIDLLSAEDVSKLIALGVLEPVADAASDPHAARRVAPRIEATLTSLEEQIAAAAKVTA